MERAGGSLAVPEASLENGTGEMSRDKGDVLGQGNCPWGQGDVPAHISGCDFSSFPHPKPF